MLPDCTALAIHSTASTWQPVFNGPGTGKVPNEHAFITGFYRDEGHTIKDLDKASYCGFVRGY